MAVVPLDWRKHFWDRDNVMALLRTPIASICVSGAILLSGFGVCASQIDLPLDVYAAFSRSPSSDQYVAVSRISPSYLQGDFNGDGKQDTAMFVKEKATEKIGIAIIHGSSDSVVVLGAGRHFGNGGDDFSWLDAWRVYPKKDVARGANEGAPPVLTGDAILVMKTMSASALVYWTGNRYGWYQQGD